MTTSPDSKNSVNAPRILKLLNYFQPFKQLEESEKLFLSHNSELVRGKIGQTLLRAEETANFVYLLVEGRIRIVGKDLRTGDIETIELCAPGQSIGWVGVLRGRSCETALCSSAVISLRINKRVISQIFSQSIQARKYWSSHAAKAELFEATSTVLKRHPDCKISTLQIIDQTIKTFRVCLANQKNADELSKLNYLWYISGGQQHGRIIEKDLQNLFIEKATYRLVGIEKNALRETLSGTKIPIFW